MTDNDLCFLKETLSFWNYLSRDEELLLLNNIMSKKYFKGEIIHNGDVDCTGVIVVKSGLLRAYLLSESGKEVTLYRLDNRDVCTLSASCILQNVSFDIHIGVELDCEIFRISPSVFETLTRQNVYVENFSLKTVIDKFSEVVWAMEQILFMSFDKRLAIFLLDEANKNGSNTVNMTHEQIAKYMCSAREVVSRMLKYFSKEGLVLVERGGITILDKTKIRELTL